MPDLVWKCHKGPQRELMFGELGKVREIGWGGAKGGGKSEVVGPKCLYHVAQHPQHARVLILREDFPQLSDLMERMAPQCEAAGGLYNKQEKVWRFPEGATIRFGYFKGGDKTPHWGKEFTFIVIDEVTRCIASEAEYLKLMLSLRNGHGIQGQILTLTNPGGTGHSWWKARFLNVPAKQVQRDSNGLARVFIPAKLSDNPTLDNDSPEGRVYRAVLESLGDAERQAFLEGDWDAFEGTVFKLAAGVHTWTPTQFRERTGYSTPPAEWTRFRVMDWGYAKPFAIYWLAVDFEGRAYCYREWYGVAKDGKGGFVPNKGLSMEPKLVAQKVAAIEAAAHEKSIIGYADPACWAKGQGDHGGGISIVDAFATEGVYWQKAKNDRISGKMALHERLHYDVNEPEAWPALVFLAAECPHAIRTIPALVYDEHVPEDVDTDGEDHCLVGDTLVHTGAGPARIADLVGTSGWLWSFDGATSVLRPFSDCRLTQKDQPVWRVRFTDGREVTATDYHPVLLESGEWRFVGEIQPGDRVRSLDMIQLGAYASALEAPHGHGREPHDSGVQRDALLPVRALLPAQGQAPAQGGVGIAARPDSCGLSRPSQGPRHIEQPAGEPGVDAAARASVAALEPTRGQGGVTQANDRADYAAGEGVARDPRGQGLALAERQAGSSQGATASADVRCVCGLVHDQGASGGALLLSDMQWHGQAQAGGNSPNDARAEGGSGAQVVGYATVEEVAFAGTQDVYNLEVADTHCFAVNGGLVVHNCYDTIRYFCMARPWAPRKKKTDTGWRERSVATRQKDWMT